MATPHNSKEIGEVIEMSPTDMFHTKFSRRKFIELTAGVLICGAL